MSRLARLGLVAVAVLVAFVGPAATAYALWSTSATATVDVRIAAPAAPPALPAGFYCGALSHGWGTSVATFGWEAVPGADSYTVYRRTGSAPGYGYEPTPAFVLGTTAWVAGSGAQTFVLTATGDTGESGFSTTVTVDFDDGSCGAPATPGRPSASTTACGTASVSWSAVNNTTSYQVLRRVNGNSYDLLLDHVSDTSAVLDQGSLPSSIDVVVRAVNPVGSSGYSSSRSVSFGGGACQAPATPTGLTSGAGCGQVQLTWNAAGYATSYEVAWRPNGNGSGTVLPAVAGTSLLLAQGSMPDDVDVRVRALNGYGTSSWSGWKDADFAGGAACQPPGTPQGVAVTDGCEQATVSWTAVAGATTYEVGWRPNHSGSGTVLLAVTGTTLTLTQGSMPDDVDVRVRALNGYGTSAWSGWKDVDFDGPGCAVPDAPASFSCVGWVDSFPYGGVTYTDLYGVSWQPAAAASEYRLYARKGGGWTLLNNMTADLYGGLYGKVTRAELSQVGASTPYRVVVRAVGAHGESANSNELTFWVSGSQLGCSG